MLSNTTNATNWVMLNNTPLLSMLYDTPLFYLVTYMCCIVLDGMLMSGSLYNISTKILLSSYMIDQYLRESTFTTAGYNRYLCDKILCRGQDILPIRETLRVSTVTLLVIADIL